MFNQGLPSIPEDPIDLSGTHRRMGGSVDDPTPYLDPARPRSPKRAGMPDRPVITQSTLEKTVAALQEEIAAMKARQNRSPLDSPAIKEGMARHNALCAAVNRGAPTGQTMYQREDRPLPIWTGKDSAEVPDRAAWFNRAVVKAHRQGVPLIDYLPDVTSHVARAWVENMLNTQAEYMLQQSRREDGLPDGGPEVPFVDNAYVVGDFTRHFMVNMRDKAELAKTALFNGTACKQGPTDTVGDYLISFQAACWAAKYDRTPDNRFHTLTLINRGLRPALQKLGITEKHSGRAYETEAKYIDFLNAKQIEFDQDPVLWNGTSPSVPSPAPTPPARHFYQHGRVNYVGQDDQDMEDWGEEAYDMPDSEGDDMDLDTEGRVCGVRQGPKGKGKSNQAGGSRSKPGLPDQARRGDTMVVPGRDGVPSTVAKRDFHLDLVFASTAGDAWPEGFTFSPTLVANPVPPKLSDRVLKAVSILSPTTSPYRVACTYQRVMLQPRQFQWCMIHGSGAHSVMDCPCLQQLCPRPRRD
jgi:hypothetical protein